MLLAPAPAKAQIGATATIQGTVTDPSGAVIPHANISVTNSATGVTVTQQSTGDGFYSVSPLDPGDYTVSTSAPGFETLVHKNVHVNGMQVLGLNVQLKIGAASQSVTVSTAPPPLETQDATIGAALEGHEYDALPLEMGSAGSPDQQRITDFAALMPGVSGNETKNNETDEPMVVDGQQQGTAMYFEGIPLTLPGGEGDPRYIWPAFNVQSVSQFQLMTSAFSAEYSGLDIENFNMKSGTNQLHGSVYDLARNTAFDAWGFLPPKNSVTGQYYKPPEHMNEYGIDAGFPVIRDKLFFFGNFEGYRYSTVNAPVYNTIPTAAMFGFNGSGADFSAAGVNIYDPTTETCTATSCTRQQFQYNGVNNVIPPSEISPIAQALSQFWKGVPYANSNLTSNFIGTYPYGLSNWDGNIRIDYHASDRNTISGILATGRQGLIGPSSQTTDVGPFPYRASKYYRPITRVGIVEDTYTINSHLVNQFKYGAAQYHSPDFNPTYPINTWAASTLGIQGLPDGQAAGGFAEAKFSGDFAPAQWGVDNGTQSDENSFDLVDNLQWVRGKHSISFGGQIQWLQDDTISAFGGSTPATLNFSYTETGQFESDSTTVNKSTGLPFASFMMGAVDSGSYTLYAPEALDTGERYRPFAFYVNDIYHVWQKLTLDLGLRWDYMPPFHEAENRWSFLNTTAMNPITASPGTLEFAGHGADSCNCTTPVNVYYKNFGPRLGLAYELNDKTVIHAAFGVYYTGGGGVNAGAAANLGYSSAPSVSSPGFGLPAFYLNGNPNFTGPAATVNGDANDPTSTTFGGTGFSPVTPPFFNAAYGTYYAKNAAAPYKLSSTLDYVDPYFGDRAPQFEGWSFGVQRMLTSNITATVSYVGNEAHFIPTPGGSNLSGARGLYNNKLDPKYLYLGGTLTNTATPANMPTGSLPYPTFNNTVAQALVAFPQYNGVSDEFGSVGNTAYDALQLTIKQRAAHGLTFMLNYTYSKTIDDVGTIRSGYAIPANVVAGSSMAWPMNRIDRSLSIIDIPQLLTFTSVWEFPFGKGHWGGGNPVVSAIVGGWALSDIFTYISGNPLAITGSSCNAPGQNQCMPSYAPGFTGSARQSGGWGNGATRDTLAKIQYVNPSAFEATPDFEIGNLARTGAYGLRGPGNYDIDGTLRRTFDIMPHERAKLEIDADVFNAVNHVWFGSTSSNDLGSIGQGFSSSPATSTSLGVVNGQANLPRQWQFEGHIVF